MRLVLVTWIVFLTLSHGAGAWQGSHPAREREILEELIEIDTSAGTGRTGDAARAMARRLVTAGLPDADVQVISLAPGVHTLVARMRGRDSAARPILLMAHIDVVGARKDDWSFDPFEFREVDGYYYGRGTNDNKAGAAMLVANFIRFRQEGFVPSRDLIIVLTGDEETTGDSIRTLVEKHRGLVDAEFALNTDAGGGELREGKPSGSRSRRQRRSTCPSRWRSATREATAPCRSRTTRSTAWRKA